MIKPQPLTTLDEICMICKCVALSKGTFVEIGTRFGGTSALIARLFPERAILTIDIKKQYEDEIFANHGQFYFIEGNSQEGPEGLCIPLTPIGVLFEDGEHKPPAVEKDLVKWSPHVGPGGFVVVHDAILQKELTVSVGGVQLSHENSNGEIESGYPEIGEVAKHLLADGWTLVDSVDSALIFQREV